MKGVHRYLGSHQLAGKLQDRAGSEIAAGQPSKLKMRVRFPSPAPNIRPAQGTCAVAGCARDRPCVRLPCKKRKWFESGSKVVRKWFESGSWRFMTVSRGQQSQLLGWESSDARSPQIWCQRIDRLDRRCVAAGRGNGASTGRSGLDMWRRYGHTCDCVGESVTGRGQGSPVGAGFPR